MSPQIGDLPLNQVVIPGTHDSGTASLCREFYQLSKDSPFGELPNTAEMSMEALAAFLHVPLNIAICMFAQSWAMATEKTVYQQLMDGIRYLDLRVESRGGDENDIRIVHSVYGSRIEPILRQIAGFMFMHPEEVLILSVGTNVPGAMTTAAKHQLFRLIDDAFKPNPASASLLAPRSAGCQKSLNELRAAGQRVILLLNPSIYADLSGNDKCWLTAERDNSLPHPTANDHIVSASTLSAEGTMKADVLRASYASYRASPDCFFLFGMQLTPNTTIIVTTALEFASILMIPAAVQQMRYGFLKLFCADPAASQFDQFLGSFPAQAPFNIITCDWYERTSLVDRVLAMNNQLTFKHAYPERTSIQPGPVRLCSALSGAVIEVQGGEPLYNSLVINGPLDKTLPDLQLWNLQSIPQQPAPEHEIRPVLAPSLLMRHINPTTHYWVPVIAAPAADTKNQRYVFEPYRGDTSGPFGGGSAYRIRREATTDVLAPSDGPRLTEVAPTDGPGLLNQLWWVLEDGL